MAALTTYSKGSIFLKGALLADCRNFTVEYNANNQEIITIEKGFAGVSPGAFRSMIRFTNAVATAGTEVDYIKSLKNREPLEVVIYARGKKVKFKGFLMTCNESYGADQPAEFSGEIMAGAPEETAF